MCCIATWPRHRRSQCWRSSCSSAVALWQKV
jgi:hypothetical protein